MTGNPGGQKFCGACGHKLEVSCPQCQTANPPHFKFCGQCGTSLSEVGAIAMARSGLITRINPNALNLLGRQPMEVQGKPFSLFIERADLVIFFSHLNELTHGAGKQSFEITLKHKDQSSIYVLLEMSAHASDAKGVETIHIALTETTDRRLEAAKMQAQQELVGLMTTVVNNINTVGDKHLAHTIQDALKKICLFARADLCCIYAINRVSNSLDPVYEWHSTGISTDSEKVRLRSVPLAKVKNTVLKLRQEKTLVVHDMAGLGGTERDELSAWSHIGHTALVCHLIYSGKIPVGVIGAARKGTGEEWPPDGVALIKFFGDYIADRLPFVADLRKAVDKAHGPPAADKKTRTRSSAPDVAGKGGNGGDKQPGAAAKENKAPAGSSGPTPAENWRILPNTTRPMLLEKFCGDPSAEQQQVFPRDDGLVLLTCPQCGLQESVSLGRFRRLGNTISVNCPCRKQFAAVLEKRRFFRKPVRFDGYFSVGGDLVGPIAANGSIWGQMVVTDLSKAGLRFSSEKAHLVHPGDLLMVRFNLDNANKSLIHKPVKVISVSSHGVGCRFEGDDNYDITLGFYFM